ncbi:MAG: hypothetical protein JWP85_270 [Rhodoglobus sp.]|nr:hypothetical protein [Rhodoglobus sp.]
MTGTFSWGNGLVDSRFGIEGDRIRVVALGPTGALAPDIPFVMARGPVELLIAGDRLPQGSRHIGLGTTEDLRYSSHTITEVDEGSRLVLVQHGPARGVTVTTTWTAFTGIPVIRAESTVTNDSDVPFTLEYISSFTYNGFFRFGNEDWAAAAELAIPHNTLIAEFQWTRHTLPSLGIIDVGFGETGPHSSKMRVSVGAIGTQPTTEYLPMGGLTDHTRGVSWLWEIEHNGSWQWELGDHTAGIYISASGPNDQEHHWHRVLRPGDSFDAVPFTITTVLGELTDAFAPLTDYRRRVRRPNSDDTELPVIFNDFMNSLLADPSEEKLLPVIAAAAKAGSEYFCVDAGWYSDEQGWWNTVGAWEESPARFPHGFVKIFDSIREAGMIPGLWVEPDVVGVESPIAEELPAEAFFWRNGARIDSQGRHQLDFRSAVVVERMDRIIDRLIADYGLGYLKFDYNINGGIGTDLGADSAGDGLLEHHRGFLRWIDGLFERHPGLVIENCSSGGARIDAASQRRFSIVSTSDQTDHYRYVPIAAGAPTALTPEQAAIWVYPQPEFGDEELRLSIVNGMLARPQLSGGMWKLSDDQLGVVATAMDVYKTYRSIIPTAEPIWPLGLPGWSDHWIAQGLQTPDAIYLAVWRRGGDVTATLPVPPGFSSAEVLFPLDMQTEMVWDGSSLSVTLPATNSARLIRLSGPAR